MYRLLASRTAQKVHVENFDLTLPYETQYVKLRMKFRNLPSLVILQMRFLNSPHNVHVNCASEISPISDISWQS